MTITKFPSGQKASNETEAGTPEAAKRKSNSVTLFQNGRFGLHFEETRMKLAIAPEMIASVLEAARPAPADKRTTIVDLLGLEEESAAAIDKIAEENDLTFPEALNFHLAMTLPD